MVPACKTQQHGKEEHVTIGCNTGTWKEQTDSRPLQRRSFMGTTTTRSPTWGCIPQTCNTDPSLQHFQETGNHRSHSPKHVIRKSLFHASKEIITAWLCQPAPAFLLIRDREVLCSQGCHNCLLSLFYTPVPSLRGGCNETGLTDSERPFKAEQTTKPFIFNLENFWRWENKQTNKIEQTNKKSCTEEESLSRTQ